MVPERRLKRSLVLWRYFYLLWLWCINSFRKNKWCVTLSLYHNSLLGQGSMVADPLGASGAHPHRLWSDGSSRWPEAPGPRRRRLPEKRAQSRCAVRSEPKEQVQEQQRVDWVLGKRLCARVISTCRSLKSVQPFLCRDAWCLMSGFGRSWKTWKSHGIFKWSFPGLEKSWKKT